MGGTYNVLERDENAKTALVERNITGTVHLEDLIVDAKKKK